MGGKRAKSLEVLNEFISKGSPPESLAMEYTSRGQVFTVLTWNCGTIVKVDYDTRADFLASLYRFREFWA